MPFHTKKGLSLHFRIDGDKSRPCLVLSNSLGTDLHMWDAQVEELARDFHVLRYDTRGHGQTEGPISHLSVARLAEDVIDLLDALNIQSAHFCGISMGGLTGQWLGLHYPERLRKLVLANTAARIGTAEAWLARAAAVRENGLGPIAEGAPARWFTQEFVAAEPALIGSMLDTLRKQNAAGYAACCEALADCDLRSGLAALSVPTLVIAGEHDPVTTVADANLMVAQLPKGQLHTIAASHLSNIEAPAAFTAAVRSFLN